MNNFSRYHKAIAFLEGLSNLPIEGDYMVNRDHPERFLKRMRYFLKLLGNPDKGIKFIHIGGTAGKGSVSTALYEILHADGKRVGLFTSPFVTTSIEKIKVDNKYINPDELADIVDGLKPHLDYAYVNGPYGRPSYFEIFIAIAFIYFKQQKCEWVVLEVGCGGRYDASNVIIHPVIAAITNIDYDHTEILGKTLKEIAYDKAGIIKPKTKFFTTEQRPSLVSMFQTICNDENADFNHIKLPRTDYHEKNKALIVAVARSLGIDESIINKGMTKAWLPCRFEVIQHDPMVILDGAHNRAKIRSTIFNLQSLKFKHLHLIIGIADNKDSSSILDQVIPLADDISITRFQIKDRKCAHPKFLFNKSKKYLKKNAKIRILLDPEMALSHALEKAHKNDLILITGSFYLTGSLREYWYPENHVLKYRK